MNPLDRPLPDARLRPGADTNDLALVLTGGGARAAYQVGLLSWLARKRPDLNIPILTGVSAGGINAAHLATHHGSFAQAVEELVALWSELVAQNIFRTSPWSLGTNAIRWGLGLLSGGATRSPVRGLVDTEPLRRLLNEILVAVDGELTRIDYNLQQGRLKSVAISTTNYSTGQTIVWMQGTEPTPWRRPQRRAVHTRLTVDHIMASSALPIFFPAVRIGGDWFGDGGIRLAAPLSPALHLGARRILAISTRYGQTQTDANRADTVGYPPPAQILGVLMNAIFLDVIDQDAARLQLVNRLLERLPTEEMHGLRPIDLVVLRPSQDLAALARDYEPRLPRAFRFMTRGLGTRETLSPDVLSMLMFQPDYLRRLIRLGEEDAEAREDEILELVAG